MTPCTSPDTVLPSRVTKLRFCWTDMCGIQRRGSAVCTSNLVTALLLLLTTMMTTYPDLVSELAGHGMAVGVAVGQQLRDVAVGRRARLLRSEALALHA